MARTKGSAAKFKGLCRHAQTCTHVPVGAEGPSVTGRSSLGCRSPEVTCYVDVSAVRSEASAAGLSLVFTRVNVCV